VAPHSRSFTLPIAGLISILPLILPSPAATWTAGGMFTGWTTNVHVAIQTGRLAATARAFSGTRRGGYEAVVA
jgi:hypothetical protein